MDSTENKASNNFSISAYLSLRGKKQEGKKLCRSNVFTGSCLATTHRLLFIPLYLQSAAVHSADCIKTHAMACDQQ
jgi:hypothetical protein